MRVLVMGAGVVGVSMAYQLLRDGHEVTVLEREDRAANGTSHANAGLVTPGHAFAWASPKVPGILLRSLWRDDQAFRFRFARDPAMWGWMLRFLRQCRADAARRNTLVKFRLSVYAQEMLRQVVAETGTAYDGARGGLLFLYRTDRSWARGRANMRIMQDAGLAMEFADGGDRIAAIEPALAPEKHKIAGGVYCPNDESGDARMFTRALAAHCAERGATFHYGTTIRSIVAGGDAVERVVTDKGDFTADCHVLALGVWSPFLARPLGVRLPIWPVKGYSVTFPVGGANLAPTHGMVDEDHLAAYTRMGERMRITATAEFAGYDRSHRPGDFRTMLNSVRDLLPEACDYGRPDYWAGLRPMTPDGPPILGRGRHRNLIYNTGHGHMGWTWASGTARICADLIAGRTPAIPLDGCALR